MDRPILFSAPMVRANLSGAKTQTRRVVNLDTLRVRLPYTVKSDLAELDPGTSIKAKPGTYRASINPQGAVSINVGGTMLGLRPGEFNFVCPYADGTTRLVDGRWHIETRGDRLWVRETWRPAIAHSHGMDACDCADVDVTYAADGEVRFFPDDACNADWTMPQAARRGNVPGIHMPRWASRITLEVTGVRVERLQDISEEDAKAEGVDPCREDHQLNWLHRCAFEHLWEQINGEDSWRENPWVWVVEFKGVEGAARCSA